MRSGTLIGVIAVAAAIILGLTWYFRTTVPVPAPAVPETITVPETVGAIAGPEPDHARPIEATPPSPVAEAPAVILPALDASDGFLRERLAGSLLPEAWVEKEDLIRRLAVVIENTGRGEIPRRQLDFMAPEGRFQIRTREDEAGEERIFVDPSSYARFDRYVDALESVPPETLATMLTDVYPLIDQALGELGAGEAVLPRVLAAIDQVLAVPVIPGDVELVQPKVFYEYAEPELEGLSPLQKQVLRMGPANVTRVQAYASALRVALLRY